MQPITVTFEMTDDVAVRAAQESLRAYGRHLFGLPVTVVIAAAALALMLAVMRDAPWPWIAGTAIPLAVYAVVLVVWFAVYAWLPGAVVRRLAHLPHRRVTVELTETTVGFGTATEQLSVAWSEVKALRRLRGFVLLCLKSGAQIPLPQASLSPEALMMLESRAVPARP